ncbi:MAG: thioredoxin family protein [Spirochaetes bacterium]|jgi:thioredoxin 1|nr:thioredoxin family protein [Spirochaetota bacterium]
MFFNKKRYEQSTTVKTVISFSILIVLMVFVSCSGKTDSEQPELSSKTKTDVPIPEKKSAETTEKDESADNKTTTDKLPIVTFIELGSVDCIPCQMMQPVMDKVSAVYGDKVDVIFYDVWTEKDRPMAEKYRIRAIPTQVFLDANGKEFYRHTGYFPFEELDKVLKAGGVR